MRTNALLLAAAIVAGGAITGAAQTVYSINAVGYVNLTIPVGFSMVANPLKAGTNTLEYLFGSNVPDFATLYKFNGVTFQTITFLGGQPDTANVTLAPGEGCFFYTDTMFTNTFVGEVVQNDPGTGAPVTNSVPAGFSIRASLVPQEAPLSTLGVGTALGDFDTVYLFNNANGSYRTVTFIGGAPDDDATVAVGQAFWVNAAVPGTWTRSFTVSAP